ncbi:MAG: ribosome maturation factor RimM [Acidobacteriota bacterium]|nr:ribosome maturation factor RimM [Acidobacteriota bacterium]
MASGATASGSRSEPRVGPSGRRDDTPADIPAGARPEGSADVVIGEVVRPFGRRGEVFVEPLTDDPGRFFEIGSAEIGPSDQPGTRRRLESVRIHKGRPVIRFDGITDIASAESLRGMEVRIGEAERVPLPEGRYYSDQLVGCRAETEEGAPLGEIVATLDTAGPSLLVLRGPDGSEDLIPFVEALCVSVELPAAETAGRVVLNVPEGLLGLNRQVGSPNAR